MNEKPVKVDVNFNEALRRIANTPKGVVVPEVANPSPKVSKKVPKVKTAPGLKKGRG